MKRIVACMLTLLLSICSGCGSADLVLDKKFRTDEYLPGFDTQDQYAESWYNIARAEDVYYVIMNNYLFYYDEATGMSGHLCGKAECMHNNESCNAYLGLVTGIQVYDGHIYWLENWGVLYRADLNGENREMVQAVKMAAGNRFAIQRGYLYTYIEASSARGGKNYYDISIYRYKLGDKEDKGVEIFTGAYAGMLHFQCRFYRNSIFIFLDHSEVVGEYNFHREILRYDAVTGEIEEFAVEDSTYQTYHLYIDDTGIHMLELMVDEDGTRNLRRTVYNLTTGKKDSFEEIQESSDGYICAGILDGYYVIVRGSIKLENTLSTYCVYDWEGNLVREGEFEGLWTQYYGVDEKGILIWNRYSDGSGSHEEISAFLKLTRIPVSSDEPDKILLNYVRPAGFLHELVPVEE